VTPLAVIPAGYYDGGSYVVVDEARWDLEGPLRVAGTTTSSNDWDWTVATIPVNVPGKPELIVQGELDTSGEWVTFNSTAASPASGNGWGGLLFTESSGGSEVRDAWISDASTLVRTLYLYRSAGTLLRGCNLDHFESTAVQIKNSLYVAVDSSRIERGANLASERGDYGVSVEESAPSIVGNSIFDVQQAGVRIVNATGPEKDACISVPVNPDTLRIDGNHIEGGPNSDPFVADGIRAAWICAFNEASISGNFIEAWPINGIRMTQCVDTRVSCNEIQACGTAFRFERSSTWVENKPPVRLKGNNLEDCAAGRSAVHTDNGQKLKLGPSGVYQGQNLLEIPSGDEWLVTQNDPSSDSSHQLNAVDCAFRINGSDLTTQATVLAEIRSELSPWPLAEPVLVEDPPDVASQWGSPCWPDDPTPGSVAQWSGGAIAASGADESQILNATQPIPIGLRLAGSNPTKGSFSFEFGVASGPVDVSFSVFDVTGRQVRVIDGQSLATGTHSFQWDGRDSRGQRVGPGVYFLRAMSSGAVETRRLVMVR
jgi:hypothetical protein